MSSRYIRGIVRPVNATVATAQAVAVGDLAALVSNTLVRAADTTWGTAVATPSAPTVAASAASRGTALTNALTGVKISYQFPWGEGALSAAGTATPTAAFGLLVSGLTPGTNALYTNVYVETAAGSGAYKLYGTSTGANIYVDAYGNGRTPPTAVNSGALEATQYAFAQAFLGVSGQRKDANAARCYGNSTDNLIRVDASGVWEFDCASATFNVGDLVGPAKDTGNALLSQTVAAVAGEALAIGRVVEAGTSVTKVKVDLLSAYDPAARKA